MEKIETSQQPNNNVWKTGFHVLKIALTFVCLILVCAGIIGYGFFYPKEPTDHFEYLDDITSPENLANLIAYGLVNGLIIWGIFYALVIRKREKAWRHNKRLFVHSHIHLPGNKQFLRVHAT